MEGCAARMETVLYSSASCFGRRPATYDDQEVHSAPSRLSALGVLHIPWQGTSGEKELETLDTWTMRSTFLAQMACFATVLAQGRAVYIVVGHSVTVPASGRLHNLGCAAAFVNNCVHTLAVLVLCIFSTCRAFRHLEVFLSRCSFVKFLCAPVFVCLKGP